MSLIDSKIIKGIKKIEKHIKQYRQHLNGKKPDEQIRQCASEYNAYIISEDKTFKILYKQTLTIKDFKEQFATYLDDIPNLAIEQLFNAIHKRDISKVKILLKESELKINAYDNKGSTPLIYAIKKRDLEIVNLLCEYKDIDIHKCDKSHLKMTPLAYAVQDDYVEMVILLLKHRACAILAVGVKKALYTPSVTKNTPNALNTDTLNTKQKSPFYFLCILFSLLHKITSKITHILKI